VPRVIQLLNYHKGLSDVKYLDKEHHSYYCLVSRYIDVARFFARSLNMFGFTKKSVSFAAYQFTDLPITNRFFFETGFSVDVVPAPKLLTNRY